MITWIQSAVESLTSEYPWMNLDESMDAFIDGISSNFDEIVIGAVKHLRLPSKAELAHDKLQERRRPPRMRFSPEQSAERWNLIESLQGIKSMVISTTVDANHVMKTDGWSRDYRLVDFASSLPYERVRVRNRVLTAGQPELPLISDDLNLLQGKNIRTEAITTGVFSLEQEIQEVSDIANELSNWQVEGTETYYDDELGFCVRIILNQDDREAFVTWSGLIDRVQELGFRSPVLVKWTGRRLLSQDELVDRSVEIMLKLGIRPRRTDQFDFVKEIEEE